MGGNRSGYDSMSDDKNPLVQVRHLKKYFPIYAGAVIQRHVGDIKAVDDVSFDIYKGETFEAEMEPAEHYLDNTLVDMRCRHVDCLKISTTV